MGWMGKIVGSTLGYVLGGPLGAVAGAALGHTYDLSRQDAAQGLFEPGGPAGGGHVDGDGSADRWAQYGRSAASSGPGGMPGADPLTDLEASQYLFFVSTFSLLGKLAKCDGVVSAAEIQVVERFIRDLGLDPDARKLAVAIFTQAKDAPHDFESYAAQFADGFRNHPHTLMHMLEILARVAAADGHQLHPAEERFLRRTAHIFGLPHVDFSVGAQQGYGQQGQGQRRPGPGQARMSTRQAYAILGVERTAPNDKVKSAYRKLIHEHHPDRAVAEGLPEEFVKLATEKLQQINEAYEAIQVERGLTPSSSQL